MTVAIGIVVGLVIMFVIVGVATGFGVLLEEAVGLDPFDPNRANATDSEPEERKRILGFPLGSDPYRPSDREPQRIFGMPTDWMGPVDLQFFRSLIHPFQSWKRWTRHRRLGPYAPDDDDGAKAEDGQA